MNSYKITNLANATIDTDALNRITADGRYYLGTTTLNNITLASGDLSMNSHKITNLATPTANADACTKAYADSIASGTSSIPVGTIIAWYSNTIPSGWLLCDGSTFDTVLYPDLFAVLG